MTPVFYTSIRPAHQQSITDITRRARAMGYELMRFNGYSNSDIGYAGNRGPHFEFSRLNLARCIEIQEACVAHTPDGNDWPHIDHTSVE